MKVLRIHAPGIEPGLTDAILSAVDAFNRSVDIRLRFLSIEIDEDVLNVDSPEQAAEAVALAVQDQRPMLCVLLGQGDTALAAASAAVRAGAGLVRVGSGRRDGPAADSARALDRLASVCLVHDDQALAQLEEEGLGARARDIGPATQSQVGERVVREISRARRTMQGDR